MSDERQRKSVETKTRYNPLDLDNRLLQAGLQVREDDGRVAVFSRAESATPVDVLKRFVGMQPLLEKDGFSHIEISGVQVPVSGLLNPQSVESAWKEAFEETHREDNKRRMKENERLKNFVHGSAGNIEYALRQKLGSRLPPGQELRVLETYFESGTEISISYTGTLKIVLEDKKGEAGQKQLHSTNSKFSLSEPPHGNSFDRTEFYYEIPNQEVDSWLF